MALRITIHLLVATSLAGLSACAETDPFGRERDPAEEEIAKVLGCGKNEIAFCVDVNCEPEDYQCTDLDDVRDLFEIRRKRH